MNIIRLENECNQFKVVRVKVHRCVCVLMHATGHRQYPAPAAGNKLWLLMNVPSKLWSYRSPLQQRPGPIPSKHPYCSHNHITLPFFFSSPFFSHTSSFSTPSWSQINTNRSAMSLPSIVIKFSLGLDTNAEGHHVNRCQGAGRFLSYLKHRGIS